MLWLQQLYLYQPENISPSALTTRHLQSDISAGTLEERRGSEEGPSGREGVTRWAERWQAVWRSQQRGIVRYNCADSLDRTNAASYFAAVQVPYFPSLPAMQLANIPTFTPHIFHFPYHPTVLPVHLEFKTRTRWVWNPYNVLYGEAILGGLGEGRHFNFPVSFLGHGLGRCLPLQADGWMVGGIQYLHKLCVGQEEIHGPLEYLSWGLFTGLLLIRS